MRVINHGVLHFFKRGLALLVLLCLVQLAAAQPTVSISPSVVLVLKLVSSTHVKPTTGIVISDGGLVLVSADFASSEGEIIVLDGGTDILSNGRPAKVLRESTSGKLAVLSVDGLKRPGIVLSENALDAGSKLHLEAFPPAERIAKGAQPLRSPGDISEDEQGSRLSISPETPLPYVSGAFIDTCGFLAGISLVSGAQSLETGKTPLIIFNDDLRGVLQELQIAPVTASCERLVQPSQAPVTLPDDIDLTTDSAEPPVQSHSTEGIEPVEAGTPDPIIGEKTESTPQGKADDPASQVSRAATERSPLWRAVPFWLILSGIIVLAVLIWKAIYFFRLHATTSGHKTDGTVTRDVQPASDEPVTAPLETSVTDSVIKPRSAPLVDLDIPELGTRPDGCDGVLLVEGMLDAETAFRRFCFVNTAQVNIVIGRGDTDIAIKHAAISRAHVRLESAGAFLTLSDLGSRNGTYIGDVPCLPGEIMYLEDNDEIYLGDVKMTLRVVKQEAEWA